MKERERNKEQKDNKLKKEQSGGGGGQKQRRKEDRGNSGVREGRRCTHTNIYERKKKKPANRQ